MTAAERLWIEACMKRDNALCQRCRDLGYITLAVEVHHGIHKSQGDYVRYLMDNGVSLCRSCHSLDNKGLLKEWCVETIGEEKFYEIKRENFLYVKGEKIFDLKVAVRKLKDYMEGK